MALQMLVQKDYNFFSVYEVSSFLISGYTIFSVWKNCNGRSLDFSVPLLKMKVEDLVSYLYCY